MAEDQITQETQAGLYEPIDHIEVAKVAVLGVIAGLLVPLLSWLIANFFIEPVFCRSPDAFTVCSSGGIIANHIGAIVVGLAAVALLVNWGVFRPLLIVLAATIVMWGLQKYLGPINAASWTEFFAFSAALHGIAYVAFYWLLRLKSFPVSLALVIIVTILAAWAMAA